MSLALLQSRELLIATFEQCSVFTPQARVVPVRAVLLGHQPLDLAEPRSGLADLTDLGGLALCFRI